MKNYILIAANNPPPPYYNENDYNRGTRPQKVVKKTIV